MTTSRRSTPLCRYIIMVNIRETPSFAALTKKLFVTYNRTAREVLLAI